MASKDELTEQVVLLQNVLRITREQLSRSIYLNAELEGMLTVEREKLAALTKNQNEPQQTDSTPQGQTQGQ